MSRPHKYGEPTTRLEIRVPQSRKEEIRELVREHLAPKIEWNKSYKSEFIHHVETYHLRGIDNNGNNYSAIGVYCNDELVNVSKITEI